MNREQLTASVFFSIGVLGAGLYRNGQVNDFELVDVLDKVTDTLDDFYDFYKSYDLFDDDVFGKIVADYYVPKLKEWCGIYQ